MLHPEVKNGQQAVWVRQAAVRRQQLLLQQAAVQRQQQQLKAVRCQQQQSNHRDVELVAAVEDVTHVVEKERLVAPVVVGRELFM